MEAGQRSSSPGSGSPPAETAIAALAQSARANRLALFCGAGVSMLPPSLSPSWWEIYVAAATALLERFREGFPEVPLEIDLDRLLKPLQTQQLADIVSQRFAGETFVENLCVVDIADPNENHVLIAALTALGLVRGVVTTNWDTLLERSAVLAGTGFKVVAPNVPSGRSRGSFVPLVKVHGSSVQPMTLIETSVHKAREIDARLRDGWSGMLVGADLLVIGYSGADVEFGAVRAFFADFLAAGGRIWWLYRPGSPPCLPAVLAGRVTLIEGRLPDTLRSLAQALGAQPFRVPLAGRDARLALRQVMDAWSRAPHVGRWSAAVFLLSLGAIGDSQFGDSPLRSSLVDLARTAAKRFAPGEKFGVTDLAAAGFLGMSGMDALTHLRGDDAVTMLRAAVNIFEAANHLLGGAEGDSGSEVERLMNLSSSWSNYGQAVRMTARDPMESMPAFQRSLHYAYMGGVASGLLIALTNIVHYALGRTAVRRCMRLAEGAIRIADRIGAVQVSIEMRLHLAGFHLARNEVWVAASELAEAKRRAAAIFEPSYICLASILEGHVLLKQGRIADGLTTIGRVLAAVPHHVFLFQPVDNVRQYLDTLGIRQPPHVVIELPEDRVAELTATIGAAIADAESRNALPWDGRHCSIPRSGAVDDEHGQALFRLGVEEFAGARQRAAAMGLHVAVRLLERGYVFDGYCAARNVVANEGAQPKQRASAQLLLAIACGELGDLAAVDRHLAAATTGFADAGEPPPIALVETGLWHAIQSGDVAAGVGWARRIGDALRGDGPAASRCAGTAARIDTWGEPMAAVGAAFREAVESATGIAMPPGATPSTPAEPFRRFHGTSAELQAAAAPAAERALDEAQRALSENDPERALELIDGINADAPPEGLPFHLAGIATALQIQALASKVEPAQLNRAADAHRENLLKHLAFGALARVESSVVWELLQRAETHLAESLLRRAFVAELSDDPRAKVSLQFWEAFVQELRGEHMAGGPRVRLAKLAARYYDTAEAPLVE